MDSLFVGNVLVSSSIYNLHLSDELATYVSDNIADAKKIWIYNFNVEIIGHGYYRFRLDLFIDKLPLLSLYYSTHSSQDYDYFKSDVDSTEFGIWFEKFIKHFF